MIELIATTAVAGATNITINPKKFWIAEPNSGITENTEPKALNVTINAILAIKNFSVSLVVTLNSPTTRPKSAKIQADTELICPKNAMNNDRRNPITNANPP
jgi:hypothetical protein